MADEKERVWSPGDNAGYSPAPGQFTPSQYGAVKSSYGQPQPVMVQQPPTTGVPPVMVHTQPAGITSVQPPMSHLRISILACLFCFWPTGLFAIGYSLLVKERYIDGDHQGAITASRMAHIFVKISIVIGMVWICIVVLAALGYFFEHSIG